MAQKSPLTEHLRSLGYVPIVNISNLTNGVHALTLTAQLVGFLNLSQTLSPKQQLPTQHFTVENSLLIIDITSPQNKTYTQCSGISLNFTVQDPSSINSPAPPGDFSFWNKAYKPIVWTAFSLDNQTTVALNSTNAYSPYYVPISKYSLELPTLSGGNHKITISTRLNNGSLVKQQDHLLQYRNQSISEPHSNTFSNPNINKCSFAFRSRVSNLNRVSNDFRRYANGFCVN